MSTKDQLLYSALHGTAMRYAAERRNLDESIEELRDIADGRNDILAEAAGITGGSWGAWRADRRRNAHPRRRRPGSANGLRRAGAVDADRVRAGYEIAQRGAVNLTYPHASEKACRARYAGAME
jgi:hypothetical protein